MINTRIKTRRKQELVTVRNIAVLPKILLSIKKWRLRKKPRTARNKSPKSPMILSIKILLKANTLLSNNGCDLLRKYPLIISAPPGGNIVSKNKAIDVS